MYAVDINCIVRELQSIIGSRVDKVFQDKSGVVRIRFYGGPAGRTELLIEAGRRIHTTAYRRKGSKTPTSYAMYLRKHLGNRRLSDVTQHDFDRVVVLQFEDLRLVIEIFARGNIVLLDPNSNVMLSMKKGPEERISKGGTYILPQPPKSPFGIENPSGLRDALTQKDLVRSLAVDLGLGRLYANEACAATGLSEELNPSELSDEAASALIEWISWMRQAIADPKNAIIYGGDDPVEFSPFELVSMKGHEATEVETLNRAADLFYAHEEKEGLELESATLLDERSERLAKRLDIQKSQLDHLIKESERFRKLGDLVYANFSRISPLLKKIKDEPRPTESKLSEFLKSVGLADSLVRFDAKNRTLFLHLDGLEMPLDVRRSIGENASRYYDKAKALERRADGASKAIRRTEREMERLRKGAVPEARRTELTISRTPEWYEKFRWFFSSEGNLVIAGRDARSNETLVRKYLEDGDIYAHADIHGAPSVVGKAQNGYIGNETIRDICIQALIHSSIWKSGTTAGDVYWVSASQVTKRPTSGEYVSRGSFVIRGKRNYERGLVARCGIGWFGNRFMCGPLDAIQRNCPQSLEIAPGECRKSEVAKEVIRRLKPEGVRTDIDQVIQVLPPGRLKIVG